jgi:hypothetical protein
VPLSVLLPVTVAEPLAAFQVCVPESVPGSAIVWAAASRPSGVSTSIVPTTRLPMERGRSPIMWITFVAEDVKDRR